MTSSPLNLNKEATNIKEVIDHLKAIISHSIKTQNRLGYFASLYCMVTQAVSDAIDRGEFEDNNRMHTLDVIFANYFFKNLTNPNAVWNSFFDTLETDNYVIMQHLLLGMNAHITYDLSQSVIDTMEGDIDSLHEDFMKIDAILNEQIDIIQDKLAKTSIFLRIIDCVGLFFDEAYSNFSMINARKEAWSNAYALSELPLEERENYITKMEENSLKNANFIKKPGIFLRFLIFLNKKLEKRSIVDNLKALKPF